jgi:hypothetical protein
MDSPVPIDGVPGNNYYPSFELTVMAPKKVAPQVKKAKKAKSTNITKPSKRGTSEIQYDAMAYARCLLYPFNAPPCHIPDPDVQPSAPISSHYTVTQSFSADSGTSTSHALGVVLYPYPQGSVSFLTETIAGTGVITDLNTAGTSRVLNSAAPNSASFGNYGYRVRLSGAGVRVIYEGTELNRAGRIFGGNLPIVFAAGGVVGGTQLSALYPLFQTPTTSTSAVRQSLADVFEIRNPSDKVVEFHWKPSAVPHYQTEGNNSVSTTTAGAVVAQSIFATTSGGQGAELGQNALIVIIDGDVTPAATANTNVYTFEVVWHWEVVPDDIQAVAFDLSPSHSHASSLDMAFNAMSAAPVGRALSGAAANYDSTGISSGPVTMGWGPQSGFQSGRRNRQ